jgi:hypothetical protein
LDTENRARRFRVTRGCPSTRPVGGHKPVLP